MNEVSGREGQMDGQAVRPEEELFHVLLNKRSIFTHLTLALMYVCKCVCVCVCVNECLWPTCTFEEVYETLMALLRLIDNADSVVFHKNVKCAE